MPMHDSAPQVEGLGEVFLLPFCKSKAPILSLKNSRWLPNGPQGMPSAACPGSGEGLSISDRFLRISHVEFLCRMSPARLELWNFKTYGVFQSHSVFHLSL